MDNDIIYDGFTSDNLPSADPSERRLTICIGFGGIKAYLKNTVDVTAGYRTLIDASWKCDESELLRHIENTVYDHPEVLDDFECDIIIVSDKLLWIPSEIAEDEECRDKIFTDVFNVDSENIFEDIIKETPEHISAVYYLCPGLPSFIRRTFPGARVSSQLTQLFHRFYGRVTDEPSVFVDLRHDRMDMLIFNGKEFLLGATHRYADEHDAYYHILNCIRQCSLDEKRCEVYLSGNRNIRALLLNDLRDELTYVRNTMLPRIDAPAEMPTAALVSEVNHKSLKEESE
ncbi:MAG: DUF3822 family protein [Prevotella sp.]|nr:DUF3822 family protein [Bacteroides sp.]MCM1366294.1 DUF3822 family protein [Prevotella sp.]MCM1437098.1 DUF3822 family protein [Prevotella sp.]